MEAATCDRNSNPGRAALGELAYQGSAVAKRRRSADVLPGSPLVVSSPCVPANRRLGTGAPVTFRDGPDLHSGRLFGAETVNGANYWIRRSDRLRRRSPPSGAERRWDSMGWCSDGVPHDDRTVLGA